MRVTTLQEALDTKDYLVGRFPELKKIHDAQNFVAQHSGLIGGYIEVTTWFNDLAERVEMSEKESVFFEGEIFPTIGNTVWRRGYWIQRTPETGVVLTIPWCWPYAGRPSIVLGIGFCPLDWAKSVVGRYLDKKYQWLEQYLPTP